MREPSRTPAMTMPESIWVASAIGVTIMAVLMAVGGPDVKGLFVRDLSPSQPVHTPVPELCAVFPGGVAAGLTLKPIADRAEHDRNKASCSFEVAGSTRERQMSVKLKAARPDLGYEYGKEVNEASELKAAMRLFLEDEKVPTGIPVAGLGDEAKLQNTTTGSDRSASVVVRDGLLVFSVSYAVETGKGEPQTSPDTVRDTVQRLAVELLKRLPPKGK